MSEFSKVVCRVCSFLHTVALVTGNFVTTLPEQRNDVTGALAVVINALYDERMHDDVLKQHIDNNIYKSCTFIRRFCR